MKITILIGLPGSGKTTLGNNMVSDSEEIIFLDDITVFNALNEIKEAINVFGWKNIVMSDVFFCDNVYHHRAFSWLKKHFPKFELERIYFENAPDKCISNILRRNCGVDNCGVIDLVRKLSKLYTIPRRVTPRQVYGAAE